MTHAPTLFEMDTVTGPRGPRDPQTPRELPVRRGPGAPHNRTDTSIAAARAIAAKDLATCQQVTLRIIESTGGKGATIEQITDLSASFGRAMKEATVCGRVNELTHMRRIRDSGKRRKTRSNTPAKVWVTRNQVV